MTIYEDAYVEELERFLREKDWVAKGPDFYEHYHDLGELFMRREAYCDWEGLSIRYGMSDHIRWIKEATTPGPMSWEITTVVDGKETVDIQTTPPLEMDEEERAATEVARDLTLHLVFENLDQADYALTEEETKAAVIAFQWLLQSPSRLWCKAAPQVNWETGELVLEETDE
jgi:hypothetical protein